MSASLSKDSARTEKWGRSQFLQFAISSQAIGQLKIHGSSVTSMAGACGEGIPSNAEAVEIRRLA